MSIKASIFLNNLFENDRLSLIPESRYEIAPWLERNIHNKKVSVLRNCMKLSFTIVSVCYFGTLSAKTIANSKKQIYLGSDAFVDRMQGQFSSSGDVGEIPKTQRRPLPKPLSHYREKYSDRDVAITMAYKSGGYSMKEIGDCFDLHYSRITRIINLISLIAKNKT